MMNFLRKETAGLVLARELAENDRARFVQMASARYRYTPDIRQLEQNASHMVFFYGDIHRHAELFDGPASNQPIPTGTAFTIHTIEQNKNLGMTLWRVNKGNLSYPVALDDVHIQPEGQLFTTKKLLALRAKETRPVTQARIRGELYLMSPDHITELDSQLHNTLEFTRRRTKVILPFHRIDRASGTISRACRFINCWMYFGNTEYWLPLLDGGINFTLMPLKEKPLLQYLKAYYWYEEEKLKAPAAPHIGRTTPEIESYIAMLEQKVQMLSDKQNSSKGTTVSKVSVE